MEIPRNLFVPADVPNDIKIELKAGMSHSQQKTCFVSQIEQMKAFYFET